LAILASAPITLDEVTIGRIVAFGEAVRRLLIDESLDERNLFRRELIDAAFENTVSLRRRPPSQVGFGGDAAQLSRL
jgi:hypothetical protein